MSKLRKFVLVRLAAAGLSIASVSVLANKEDVSLIEHGPDQNAGQLEKRKAALHDTLRAPHQSASKAQPQESKAAGSGNEHDWSDLLALHAEAEGLSIR